MAANRGEEPAVDERGIAAWKLPPIVAAIALPIVGGFYLGGPGLGMAVGALAAAAILVIAARNPPLHPISPPSPDDFRRHLLVVLEGPLEDGEAIEAIARAARGDTGPDAEVVLLAPCRNRFLDRWACDLDRGREGAQRELVLAAASLAAAGIEARARVGGEGLVQTVEDELRTFPATEVILLGGDGRSGAASAAARDLGGRLAVPLRQLGAAASAQPAPRPAAAPGRRRYSGAGTRPNRG
jgi:hypothetical protein